MDRLIENYEQSLEIIKEMEEKGYNFIYNFTRDKEELKEDLLLHFNNSDIEYKKYNKYAYLFINEEDKTYHFYTKA